VAALVEILAYYIPAVDSLLDSVTGPLALIAGSVVAAAVITDLPPLWKWSTAIIAGGGVAAITQGVTTLVRAKSTAFTAGIGNPVVSTVEMIAAVVVALLALLAPLLALALVVAFCWFTVRLVRRFLSGRATGTPP
jgi:cobalamin synthase